MADYTVTIDMDKKCAECRKGGAVPNGLCLKCTSKAFRGVAAMKSAQGKAVAQRMVDQLKKARS